MEDLISIYVGQIFFRVGRLLVRVVATVLSARAPHPPAPRVPLSSSPRSALPTPAHTAAGARQVVGEPRIERSEQGEVRE